MKSRSNTSAFFVFLKALLAGIAVIFPILLLELYIFGVLSQFSIVIRHSIVWVIPVVSGLVIFLFLLVKNRWFQLLLALMVPVGLFAAAFYSVAHPSVQLLQILYLRDRIAELETSDSTPRYSPVQMETTQPFPIYVSVDDQAQTLLTPVMIEELIQWMDGLPEILKQLPTGLYFLEEGLFQQEAGFLASPSTFGFSQNPSMSVALRIPNLQGDLYYTVFKDGREVVLSDPEFYHETIVHELCHLLDVRYTGDTLLESDRADWQALFNEYGQVLGEYGATSPTEFFSETGVCYFLYPDMLLQNYPDLYHWYDQMVDQKQDAADFQAAI